MNSKASEHDVEEARLRAAEEANDIIAKYERYLNGDTSSNVLEPRNISGRLDLRNCVPMLGRMTSKWAEQGEVKELRHVVKRYDKQINPSDYPDQPFSLLKVSYDGRCELEDKKIGSRIRTRTMRKVAKGQIVFSTIRATDGAIGIVPPELDGALVSKSSYTVFECESAHDAAYLWSVLRSYELRADMQSLSPGSGRYTTYWPEVGRLMVPWASDEYRRSVGEKILKIWQDERELEARRQESLAHLDELGVESEDSRRRWTASKAPQ